MESREMKWVYDTLLAAPGMEDMVKVDLRISRKLALFLVTAIEKGLDAKGRGKDDLFSLSAEVTDDDLQTIVTDMLAKAGIAGMYEKLRELDRG